MSAPQRNPNSQGNPTSRNPYTSSLSRTPGNYLTMTPFCVNDRVWYWSAASQTVFGTVVAIERLADGTQLLVIERDTGGRVSFPPRVLLRTTSALFDWVLPPSSTTNFRPLRPRTSVLFDRVLRSSYTLGIARSLRTHQPRPPYFLVTRKQAARCITMDLFVRSQASERRTMPIERLIKYDHKRGSQPDDTLRIPSWHASDHPSLSLDSDYSVTSRIPSSEHASDHSSTSPVIYHNCRCSSTCPLSGHSASRPADQPLSQTLNTGPLSQTYGTPSDQLRRADYHHRGSTFSFHDDYVSTSHAYRH
ncbi:hypothetical protein EV121DRAFT_294562 [Schizophyllum commune]